MTACSETHPQKTTSVDISNQKLLLASADSARLRGSCGDFLHAGAQILMHLTVCAYAIFPTIDLCRACHAPCMSRVCCVLLARARSGEGALAQSLHTPHDHDRTPGVVAGSFGRATEKGWWRSRRRLRAHLGCALAEPDTAARHPKLALEYLFLSVSGPGFPSRQIFLLFAERSPAHKDTAKRYQNTDFPPIIESTRVALARRSADFSEIAVLSGFCGVCCALASAWQAASNLCTSNSWAWKL